MTDRDRLIELFHKAEDICDRTLDCDTCKYVLSGSCKTVLIADYLLANGVIVPPFNIGDTIYEINTNYPKAPFINRFVVIAFHITSGKNILGHKKPSHAVVGVDYMPSLTKRIYLENFGKTVFLTKEEAEAKLKELGK